MRGIQFIQKKEALCGEYSRIYLSCLNYGLKPETLARLFCLSSKKERDGRAHLEEMLLCASSLVSDGTLPLDREKFGKKLDEWRGEGYPPVHHSDTFRREYRPAYRVVANCFADFLPLFTEMRCP